MEVLKLQQLKKTEFFKKILEYILYIEMNGKVSHKIVRKIDVKTVTKVF